MNKLYLVFIVLFTCIFMVNPVFSAKSETNEIKKKDFRKGIVGIKANNRQGTGFVVGVFPKEIYIITVSHVVEGEPNPTVKFFKNQEFKAKVLFNEEELDLSILLVKDKLPKNIIPLYLEKTFKELEYDDKLFTFGFPNGGADWTHINLSYSALKGSKILLSGNINEGNSGSPIIKEDKVVGIITSTTKFAYAQSTVTVRLFLSGVPEGNKILKNMEKLYVKRTKIMPFSRYKGDTTAKTDVKLSNIKPSIEKWIGTWKHTEATRSGLYTNKMELRLVDSTNNILVGEYNNNIGKQSFLEGNVIENGKILEGTWGNPKTEKSGRFRFELKGKGFYGNYNMDENENIDFHKNKWEGKKIENGKLSYSKLEIDSLLTTCKTHHNAKRLTIGIGRNAFLCYKEVLEIEPDNNEASNGLKKIEERYVSLVEKYLNNGDAEQAEKYLTRLNKVNPNFPDFGQLFNKLLKLKKDNERISEKYYDVYGVEKGNSLNIRKKPKLYGDKIGKIPHYEQCIIYLNEKSGAWRKIHYKEIIGWVHIDYIIENFSCNR